MFIVIFIYAILVYFVFYKCRWLPLNVYTRSFIILVGVVLSLGFFIALKLLTPATANASITTRIVEISPQVSGRVDRILVERNQLVEAGAPLFTIDPTAYRAKVEELEANLKLSSLRLQQYEDLAEADAASRFQLQATQAEVAGLQARLDGARFDLQNTTVRAPSRGLVPRMFLKEGRQVSPLRSVLTFMDTSELMIGGLINQVSFQNIRLGNKAFVNFSALPGRIFETEVVIIPRAIGDSQLMATGALPKVMNYQTARLFPIYLKLPEDLPQDYHNVGTAATVYIHTEEAGAFGKVANAIQWLSSSLALFL